MSEKIRRAIEDLDKYEEFHKRSLRDVVSEYLEIEDILLDTKSKVCTKKYKERHQNIRNYLKSI